MFITNIGLPRGAFRRIGSTDQRCQDDDLAVFYQSRHTTFYDATLLKDAICRILTSVHSMNIANFARVNPGASELELFEELLRALRCLESMRQQYCVPLLPVLCYLAVLPRKGA